MLILSPLLSYIFFMRILNCSFYKSILCFSPLLSSYTHTQHISSAAQNHSRFFTGSFSKAIKSGKYTFTSTSSQRSQRVWQWHQQQVEHNGKQIFLVVGVFLYNGVETYYRDLSLSSVQISLHVCIYGVRILNNEVKNHIPLVFPKPNSSAISPHMFYSFSMPKWEVHGHMRKLGGHLLWQFVIMLLSCLRL